MKEWQIEYNRLLGRERKGEEWLDDPSRTEAEMKRFLPAFEEILMKLSLRVTEFDIPAHKVLVGFEEGA